MIRATHPMLTGMALLLAGAAQSGVAEDTQLLRLAMERNGCVFTDDAKTAAAIRAVGLDNVRIGPALRELLQGGEVVAEPDGLKLRSGVCA